MLRVLAKGCEAIFFMLTIDLTHIEGLFGQIEGFVGSKAIAIAARVVKQRMIALSQQGLDAYGVPFILVQTRKGLRPYSLGYESYKSKIGGQIQFRNLTVSGDLLNSIYLDGNELKFPPEFEPIAEGNIYLKTNSELIKFWHVSPETLSMAEEEIEQEMMAELQGWIST